MKCGYMWCEKWRLAHAEERRVGGDLLGGRAIDVVQLFDALLQLLVKPLDLKKVVTFRVGGRGGSKRHVMKMVKV